MTSADKILGDLASIQWWFTAVVVALLINLASAYAKPWIDRALEALSLRRTASRTRRRQDFEDGVETISADPYLLLLERMSEVRDRVQQIYFLLGCVLMVGLAGYFIRATDLPPIVRYLFIALALGSGVLAYLFFFRLVVRANETNRRYETALRSVGKGD